MTFSKSTNLHNYPHTIYQVTNIWIVFTFAIINTAAMNIHVQLFVWTYQHIFKVNFRYFKESSF